MLLITWLINKMDSGFLLCRSIILITRNNCGWELHRYVSNFNFTIRQKDYSREKKLYLCKTSFIIKSFRYVARLQTFRAMKWVI